MNKKIFAGLLALLTLGSFGFGNVLSFKLNYFVPRAQSGPNWPDSLWTIELQNMSYTKTNFQEGSFGFEYDYFLTSNLSLVIGIDTYSKNKTGYYKDYVGYNLADGDWAFPADYQGDFTPRHSLNISITPIQFSLKIAPLGRRSKLIPYVGAGVGIYFFSVRMRGDMVDFSDEYVYEDPDYGDIPVYPIYYVDAWEGGNFFGKIGFGWHVFGGFMFPVANRLTLDIAFKFNNATGKFTEAFEGFDYFDIGGYQISFGLNYWF